MFSSCKLNRAWTCFFQFRDGTRVKFFDIGLLFVRLDFKILNGEIEDL